MLRGLPAPLPDHDTKPFWDGCAEGRFLVPHCRSCGAPRWPPGPMCPVCQSRDTEWRESSGRGRVYTWVVANYPAHQDLADQVPYVVGLVALEEGVRVVANITGYEPDEIDADMPVALYFEELPDGGRLPNFRRVPDDRS